MEDRLVRILKHLNLSSAAFADRLGVQRSSISHILSGRNKPGFDFISKLALEFPEINIEWFVTGKGNMLKSSYSKKETDLFSGKEYNNDENKGPDIIDNDLKSERKVTNVISTKMTNVKNIQRIIVYYSDYTWEEFSASGI